MPIEKLVIEYPAPDTLRLSLSQNWRLSSGLPSANEIIAQLNSHPQIKQINFSVASDFAWDSAFISFMLHLAKETQARNIRLNSQGLPQGVEELVSLTLKSRENIIQHEIIHENFLEAIGTKALQAKNSVLSLLDFLGQIAVAFGRLFRGKVYFRRDDFFAIVQRCGADALGLVSLISILVGIIFAFIGAIQLRMFGAQIYIADIVGIAMVRVMGAVMTGILMSGRTGAAFAAELGIMQTNEEIDALKTLGVNPVEFLVMPRVMALVIMMPLLTLYADLMGIVGGFFISTGILGINPVEYLTHTQNAVKLSNLWVGLIHSLVFGVIIAVAGCLRGMNCERSAAGVGEATTSAVVSAITSIVIATAIITFVCQVLGI